MKQYLFVLILALFILCTGCNITEDKQVKKAEAEGEAEAVQADPPEISTFVDGKTVKETILQMKLERKKYIYNAVAKSTPSLLKAASPKNTPKKPTNSTPATKKETTSSKPKLIDAPLIAQLPELPRGCEVTSLAMMLNDAGISVDKMTLAKQIKKDPTPYQVKDGKIYFGNPNTGFVGDMYSLKNHGFGVFHGPIYELAKHYLGDRVIDITGKGFSVVEKQLDQGKPVWVINTSWFSHISSSEWQTWYTPIGKISITMHEHSVLVTGYDDHYIYFNDPLAVTKNRKIDRSHFIAGWQQYGEQAISFN